MSALVEYQELAGKVRRYARKHLRDDQTADDVTQDVMLKLIAHLDSMPEKENLSAWVFQLARNAIIDHYRARAVREHVDVNAVDPPETEDVDAQREIIDDLSSCLTRMIEHLDEPYREALKQADLEGISQQEVADRAGITLSGAKSRVQRARQQLREMFLQCCAIEQDRRGRIVDYHPTDRACSKCDEADGSGKCG